MRYVRRFNSKRGPRLGSGSALTMPYHAYAPLPHWPVTPSPSPSRVSSVTFPLCVCVCAVGNLCSCQDASRSSRRSSRSRGRRAAGLAAWLAFYFILFALITSPATLLKNIFACWEISRSLFPAPGPLHPLPVQGVQGHGMPRSRTCSRAGRRRRLGKCIRFARAVNVKTMAQVFGCQLRKGKCAGKIA